MLRKPPLPSATASQKTDIAYLERVAPPQGALVPAAATVSPPQLYEVERLAGIGANLNQIRIHLRVSPEVWEKMLAHNPTIAEAYEHGENRYAIEAMEMIREKVEAGDPGMLRLLADRGRLGDQWKAPRQAIEVTRSETTTSINVDVVASVDAAFDRQSRLLESEAVEVEAEADSNPERSAPKRISSAR